MWFANRPLRRIAYAQRVAAPPVPAAWLVVYTHLVTRIPSETQCLWLAGFYVVVCVWYGSLRELSPRRMSTTQRYTRTFNWWRNGLLRVLNTISDAAAAACFLYFLVFREPAYFPIVLFVSGTTHVLVEMEIQHRLECMHSDHAYFGGRSPTADELVALDRLGDIDEVTVVGVHSSRR